jgi:competence protein ComEC
MSIGIGLSLTGVAGVLAGVLSSAPSNTQLALAILGGALALGIGSERRVFCRALLWTAWLAAAIAYGADARERAQMPVPDSILLSDSPVVLEGRLARDASQSDAGVRLEIGAVRITVEGAAMSLPQLDVLAIVAGTLATPEIAQWTAGRHIRVPARLRVPAFVRNPGSPSVRWQALTRPFDLIAAVKSGSLVEVQPGAPWHEMAASARRYVRGVTQRWVAPVGTQSAAVVTAILIGDRAGLDPEVTRRLQSAGTFHVIAISGGNVAILTMMCFVVLRMLTRREPVAIVLTLIVLLTYGLVVGRDPSVSRAILAASIYLGLRLCGLLPQALNVLAITALVCVLVEPLLVLDVGAWLSFGATLGLVTILPRLVRAIAPAPSPGEPRLTLTAVGIVRGLFLATVAAELMIAPVMASVFMRMGVAGLPLNFVAIPAMTIAQLSGIALCAVAPWWEGGAMVLARACHWATVALIGSASLVDVAPWLSWRVAPPPMALVCVYYAALTTALLWQGRRVATRSAVWMSGVCILAMATGPWVLLDRPPRGWLRVTVADVGQGEAIAVQLPSRDVLVVDAGGSSGGFDVGGRVVTPALWASGIRRVNWLALTHGDVDHVGGARQVTEDLRPLEIWEGVPVPNHVLLDQLRHSSQGVVWRRIFAGHHLDVAGASIDAIHPPLPDWERRRVRNDDSLVLRHRR